MYLQPKKTLNFSPTCCGYVEPSDIGAGLKTPPLETMIRMAFIPDEFYSNSPPYKHRSE